jgi:succinate dehydrogenase/fumarate reductase cytochrome b subunit
MKNFKHQEYFVVENATNFKNSGIYFLLALFVVPIVINILRGVEYLISSSTAESDVEKQFPDWFIKMVPFISEKIPGLIMFLIVGLFLYVMGEVIQKAVDVKEENDLTI